MVANSRIYNQHVQKLRRNRDVSAINNAAGGSAPTTPKATAKGGGGGGRKRGASRKKWDRELSPVDDGDEVKNLKRENSEELEVETPVKRVKKEYENPDPDWI